MSYSQNKPLLTPYQLGDLQLKNRVVMSALTRSRATNEDLRPTAMHAEYYAQRASAGLIITESVWVSRMAIGYINIPGIYSDKQIEGWKHVTEAVHSRGGKIFVQIAHSGASTHPDHLEGAVPFGPSAINPQEKSFTPDGFKSTVTPREYTKEEIRKTINEFRMAAINAQKAGFDGLEIHAQLFTLIPQFLSSATNKRDDEYGGSIKNRARVLFEILEAFSEVIPLNRVGIKFTPSAFNEGIIKPNELTIDTYNYVLEGLNDYNLAYVHMVGPALELKGTVLEPWGIDYYSHFRKIYKGTLMLNSGFTWETGNEAIADGLGDLISYGRYFISNPDLVERFDQNVALAEPDTSTFYTGGENGYIDYKRATS